MQLIRLLRYARNDKGIGLSLRGNTVTEAISLVHITIGSCRQAVYPKIILLNKRGVDGNSGT
jgi:hypothetical protein